MFWFQKSNSKKQEQLKYRLLQHLYTHGPSPVATLCDTLGISTPTAVKLLSEMSRERIVEKKGQGESIGGRRPDLFRLRKHVLFIICIDIELFKTSMVIVDNNNNLITPVKSIPVTLSRNRAAFLETLLVHMRELAEAANIESSRLIGCSVGMPGLIDTQLGENLSYLLDETSHLSLREAFEQHLGLPVVIQNDVKGSALAELRFGHAKGKKNVLVILMDWGIGLGIIMDGKVQQGSSGFSGEMGHMPFAENGELCYCGKHGCLETVASGMTLSKTARQGILSGQNSIINDLSNKEVYRIETELIIRAANNGDQYSIQLLSNIGTHLGKGISILIQLFNPELVILSGKIAAAKQYITLPMQQAINTYCMTQIREKAQIVSSELGDESRLLGYAAEGITQFFEVMIAQAKTT
ncbi:ROK family transcriptional regulator [Chitinophaga sp. GCM10012297]|uniref:ROK family transcriptional regulator n=1 Tax=Chitinophaga chungangae TaxID=2821488 RepID=A0ABS3Y9G9_9BACT|nr:ROK family transcriptional regulator [Chitinophaga chungangae]MBO9151319.1 ROK family transcriptional regulator [Chitinophaga chungangae]